DVETPAHYLFEPAVRNRHLGPSAFARRASSVASGTSSASARETYQPSLDRHVVAKLPDRINGSINRRRRAPRPRKSFATSFRVSGFSRRRDILPDPCPCCAQAGILPNTILHDLSTHR